MKNLAFGIMAVLAVFLYSCNSPETDKNAAVVNAGVTNNQPKIGDLVHNDEVCMVNNAYMGKKQLEVKYDGKVYYGCCADCQNKIPTQESARTATDPVSKKPVDKATAIIAISDQNDGVLYFENQSNYTTFFNK
ncbi:hypothetical protein [Kaistella carnis]|uniref:hypothetical protein n=1 Tax=Kaistella carnis TaxID=1241979 RepID=UPI0028A7449B|nr:hypothetical protein [Kaistella carnis]